METLALVGDPRAQEQKDDDVKFVEPSVKLKLKKLLRLEKELYQTETRA